MPAAPQVSSTLETLSRAEMARAVRRRSTFYDYTFYYAVKSTGIFCLPSCSSRNPLNENLAFFSTAEAASREGYRPCKRCSPTSKRDSYPSWIDRLLAGIMGDGQRRWTDEELRASGFEPVNVRRWFDANCGMTFQTFQRRYRLAVATQILCKGGTMSEAIATTAYRSESAFRDAVAKIYGVTPTAMKSAQPIVATEVDSPVGRLMIAANNTHVCGLSFLDRRPLAVGMVELSGVVRSPVSQGNNAVVEATAAQLDGFFAGKRQAFDVPLQLSGTAFQRRVWETLLTIPYGETVSYGDLAEMIDKPNAYRAVGNANGANRIAIIIPCHRVIAAGGKLGGYGGSLWRKQALLDLEQKHT